jgi:hypothetical protein
MAAAGGIDELDGDAHPVRHLANRPLQDVAHAQFAADLLYVDRSALVGEGRIAGHHEQPS